MNKKIRIYDEERESNKKNQRRRPNIDESFFGTYSQDNIINQNDNSASFGVPDDYFERHEEELLKYVLGDSSPHDIYNKTDQLDLYYSENYSEDELTTPTDNNVIFKDDEFNASTLNGKKIIAHELTDVVEEKNRLLFAFAGSEPGGFTAKSERDLARLKKLYKEKPGLFSDKEKRIIKSLQLKREYFAGRALKMGELKEAYKGDVARVELDIDKTTRIIKRLETLLLLKKEYLKIVEKYKQVIKQTETSQVAKTSVNIATEVLFGDEIRILKAGNEEEVANAATEYILNKLRDDIISEGAEKVISGKIKKHLEKKVVEYGKKYLKGKNGKLLKYFTKSKVVSDLVGIALMGGEMGWKSGKHTAKVLAALRLYEDYFAKNYNNEYEGNILEDKLKEYNYYLEQLEVIKDFYENDALKFSVLTFAEIGRYEGLFKDIESVKVTPEDFTYSIFDDIETKDYFLSNPYKLVDNTDFWYNYETTDSNFFTRNHVPGVDWNEYLDTKVLMNVSKEISKIKIRLEGLNKKYNFKKVWEK